MGGGGPAYSEYVNSDKHAKNKVIEAGTMLHWAVILALTAFLPHSLCFCPDGCACDEDILHVTCLRSNLEVGQGYSKLFICA